MPKGKKMELSSDLSTPFMNEAEETCEAAQKWYFYGLAGNHLRPKLSCTFEVHPGRYEHVH